MNVLAVIISMLLGVALLLGGAPKILRTAHYRERARHWRLPASLLPIIGIVEVGGASLLLVGAATRHDPTAIAGAALLVATMAGAILTHVRIADPPTKALPATVLGALAALDVALLTV